MKIADRIRNSISLKRESKSGKRGVALVTVLTVMSLTTILVLTFFALATSEHRASNIYSNGLQAQQVGEQAVNMVIAQIRKATTDKGRATLAWASQPGGIRVWDSKGGFRWLYKLYSDEHMMDSEVDGGTKDFDELVGWTDRPDHFVDLNEPVIRGDTATGGSNNAKVYYPIVDPRAADVPKWPKKIPGENDDQGVEGFHYNRSSHVMDRNNGSVTVLADEASAIGRVAAEGGHVAMPVRWLYQLADGTLGTLDNTNKFQALEGGGTKPDENNRIVARFAFWADDETAKLNLNTHAGGLAWDTPRCGGDLDMAMGKYQPAQHEWQRYPGHPATTHLIPVLAPGVLDIVNDRDAMEMIFEVVPRVVGGGSESGTRLLNTNDPEEEEGLVPDNDPLFPSIDDMVLKPDRTPHEFPDPRGRPIPADELSEYLERAKFFMTVTSRAPETNLFNQPKVAIWPVTGAAYQSREYDLKSTIFDQLIQYCASMGKAKLTSGEYPRYEYIFKRLNADSSEYDYNQIQRNKDLYAYLDNFLSSDIPGWGGSFYDKYGKDNSKQLLTMIFDYIRCTNLFDDSLYGKNFEKAFTTTNDSTPITYTNPRFKLNKTIAHPGHGQVVPIEIPSGTAGGYTRGMGRFHTLANTGVVTICCAEPYPDGNDPQLQGKRHLYGGYVDYRGNVVVPASNEMSMNIPPMPEGNYRKEQKATWPQWLKNIDMQDPELALAHFDQSNWNWQLAFLDGGYRNRVLQNPTGTKFQRSALSPGNYDAGTTRLQPGERLVQSIFVFNLFSPSIGWTALTPDMEIGIDLSELSFRDSNSTEIKFLPWSNTSYPGRKDTLAQLPGKQPQWVFATNFTDSAHGDRRYGGLKTFDWTLSIHGDIASYLSGQLNDNPGGSNANNGTVGGRARFSPIDRGYQELPQLLGSSTIKRQIEGNPSKIAQSYRYDLVTLPYKVQVGTGVQFSGGRINFSFYHGGERAEGSKPQQGVLKTGIDNSSSSLQDIQVEFPSDVSNKTVPTMSDATAGYENEFGNFGSDSFSALERASLTRDAGNPELSGKNKYSANAGSTAGKAFGRMGQLNLHRYAGLTSMGGFGRGANLASNDVIQMVGIYHGDVRLAMSRKTIDADFQSAGKTLYSPHWNYGSNKGTHVFTNSVGSPEPGFNAKNDGLLVYGINYRGRNPLPFVDANSKQVNRYGDFDNGHGLMIDGPYINKPDEGNTNSLKSKYDQELGANWEAMRDYGEFPYFAREWRFEAGGPAYFSPNRMLPGPGMFGSLPTGAGETDQDPYRTLLFRPNVIGNGYESHPGAEDPPDHLIMDLFWMPVVEPYAISEPLSTAGKINLNFDIIPFRHIERSTALRGVFRSEMLLCIPNEQSINYKHNSGRGKGYHWRDAPFGGELQGKRLRSVIVEDETLQQFRDRFDQHDHFKSATEICDIHLISQEVAERTGVTNPSAKIGTYKPSLDDLKYGKYWRDHSVVGDNSRERPYTDMQTRLTTKSNTFKVHYRAQVLKQGRRDNSSEYAEWDPEFDTVQAEYRGSSVVERYVDPNDDEIPDFATSNEPSLDPYYRFRIVNPRRFAP